jgi:hypothetical protein
MRLAQRRAGRTGKDVLPLGAPDSLWNIPLGEWHEQKHLALVAGYCARVERVLDVALHHQPRFIARSVRAQGGNDTHDGVTMDRGMADVLGLAEWAGFVGHCVAPAPVRNTLSDLQDG